MSAPARRPSSPPVLLLVLSLGLPPLVLQLLAPVPRLDSDAVEYFSHLRSLYFDRDLDFANEFAHFGILTRGDKLQPTVTGHRRTIFSVGPALLWMPFYAVGDLLARGFGDVEEGYSPWHIRAVCVASWFYGLAGLLLLFRVLSEIVEPTVAFWSVFLLLYGTFLCWYMVHEAAMSHAVSFFMAALVLAVWWRERYALTVAGGLALGLLIGLAAAVRWQNGVLLLLPGATLLSGLRRSPRAALAGGLLLLATFALGVSPQLLAWKAVFGRYLLLDPPHGRDFLRLDHPYLMNTLFSSRHGLLYWTPVLWAGFLGFLGLWRRERFAAGALLLPLLAMSYVNACSGDWWAGGSFSNRRFDSALPMLALGLGASLEALLARVRRSPGDVVLGAGLGLVLWNLLLMAQYRAALLPLDDTVSFARVTEGNARLLARAVGTPLAWPANWLFARAHALGPDRYDLMVGPYLFYRQNNLGGVIDVGEERIDAALVAGDWGARVACGRETCRKVTGRARVFVPLDVPEPLDVIVHAAGTGTLVLAVNGGTIAEFPLAPELSPLRAHVAARALRRELNEVTLSLTPGSEASVDRLVFERVAAPAAAARIR